jgi:hypothetical protein
MAVCTAAAIFGRLKEKNPKIVKFVSRKLNLSLEQCTAIPFQFNLIMDDDTSYDDSDSIFMFTKLLLKESGYIAEVTSNSNRDRIHIVILDLEF